jgi:endonuclease III
MEIDMFRNPQKPREALFIAKGADINEIYKKHPELKKKYGTKREATQTKGLIGLNATECIKKIKENGFYEEKADYKTIIFESLAI